MGYRVSLSRHFVSQATTTSTLRFNLGDNRLRDEERQHIQKLSRELIELKANHYRVTESRLTRAHCRMRKRASNIVKLPTLLSKWG